LARVIRAPSAASAVTTTVLIEIEGARVAVSSGANAETLRAVFDALRARASASEISRLVFDSAVAPAIHKAPDAFTPWP
jgi:hypothetical protein